MGSPVSLSGFNGIDFGTLLNAVMTQESVPLRRLETQQSDVKGQNQILAGLVTRLGKVQDAADSLSQADSLQILKATTSDEEAVSATAGDGTATGSYDVVVTQLARAQVTTTNSTAASTDTVVANAGTLTLTRTGGDPVVVTLTGDTTLEELTDLINDAEDVPVRAAIVRSAPNAYRLVLTATDTGLENAFTIASTLSGGAGLTFTDTDSDGTSGDSALDNAVEAQDAALTVNNIAISSASNVVEEAIPGVALTLRKVDADATVRIEVTRDTTAAKTKVKEFVDAYNAVLTFFDDQRLAQVGGKNNVSRDPLIRSLQTSLRTALFDTYGAGALTQLAQVGIAATAGGKLEIDDDVFDTAINAEPDAAQLLFGGTGEAGAFGAFTTLVKSYTQSGGLIAVTRTRMTDRAAELGRQIDSMSARLEQQRLTLQREYTAADQAMSRLRNQQAQLSTMATSF
ncbi:MAG: flagellar filament capping protein FliD [Vicinamibacterales bacterium]